MKQSDLMFVAAYVPALSKRASTQELSVAARLEEIKKKAFMLRMAAHLAPFEKKALMAGAADVLAPMLEGAAGKLPGIAEGAMSRLSGIGERAGAGAVDAGEAAANELKFTHNLSGRLPPGPMDWASGAAQAPGAAATGGAAGAAAEGATGAATKAPGLFGQIRNTASNLWNSPVRRYIGSQNMKPFGTAADYLGSRFGNAEGTNLMGRVGQWGKGVLDRGEAATSEFQNAVKGMPGWQHMGADMLGGLGHQISSPFSLTSMMGMNPLGHIPYAGAPWDMMHHALIAGPEAAGERRGGMEGAAQAADMYEQMPFLQRMGLGLNPSQMNQYLPPEAYQYLQQLQQQRGAGQ